MRYRTIRNFGTIIGVIVVIAVLAWGNNYNNRRAAAERFEKMRTAAAGALGSNTPLASWEMLRATGGSFSSGPEYPGELKERDGLPAVFIGYGVPVQHYRYATASLLPPLLPSILLGQGGPRFTNVTQFLLTPLPMECYFRENPPVNNVVYVELDRRTDIPDGQPIIVQGDLELTGEPGRFFYALRNAVAVNQ